MAKKATPSSREAILDAALRVATDRGLLALTLDSVAREAGVSKGGLIYHFGSKDDLIRGLLEHFGGKLERAVIERVAADPAPTGRWMRAIIGIAFPEPAGPATSPPGHEIGQFMLTLLAAAAVNPKLVEPLRPYAERVRARILAEGPDGIEQMLTWLIIDGMLLWEMVGLLAPDDPLRDQVIAAVRDRVRPRGEKKPSSTRKEKS